MCAGVRPARGGCCDTAPGGGLVASRRRLGSLRYGHGTAPGHGVGSDRRSGGSGSVRPAACRSASDRARSSTGRQGDENDRAAAGRLWHRLTSHGPQLHPRMQFLTPKLRTIISPPDVTVNVNTMSPSVSTTWSDNLRSLPVAASCPAWRVTSHRYW